MPLPNNHACLLNPAATKVLGSEKREASNGKTYTVRFARPPGKTTGSIERSYLYPKSTWSESEARRHCADHDGSFEAAKTTQSMRFAPCIDCDDDI